MPTGLSYALPMSPRSLDAALTPSGLQTVARPEAGAASAPREATTAARIRFENWDRLRVIAALDTVALHLTDHHALLGVGLPLFLILSIALGVTRPSAPSTRIFLGKRFDRVIVPWLFWSLIIALHRGFVAVSRGEAFWSWFEWEMLLYGPRIHLWFLPAVIAAGLVAHLAHRMTESLPTLRVASVGLVLGVLLLPLPPGWVLGWPFEQWLFMVPAIPLGFALGRFVAAEPRREDLRRLLLLAFVWVAVVGFVIALTVPNTKAYAFRFVGAFGLLAAATWLPNRADRLTAHLVPLMLGTYVLHPWIYAAFLKAPLAESGVGGERPVVIAAGFLAAMAVTALLRRVPLVRRFL